MFGDNLIHTAEIKRLTTSGNKEVYQTTGSFPCMLQPLSDQASQQAGLNFSKGFRCYVLPSVNIQANDEVTIDSEKYKTHSVKHHNYGSDPHKRVLLELIV